jgi:hypothetical protein
VGAVADACTAVGLTPAVTAGLSPGCKLLAYAGVWAAGSACACSAGRLQPCAAVGAQELPVHCGCSPCWADQPLLPAAGGGSGRGCRTVKSLPAAAAARRQQAAAAAIMCCSARARATAAAGRNAAVGVHCLLRSGWCCVIKQRMPAVATTLDVMLVLCALLCVCCALLWYEMLGGVQGGRCGNEGRTVGVQWVAFSSCNNSRAHTDRGSAFDCTHSSYQMLYVRAWAGMCCCLLLLVLLHAEDCPARCERLRRQRISHLRYLSLQLQHCCAVCSVSVSCLVVWARVLCRATFCGPGCMCVSCCAVLLWVELCCHASRVTRLFSGSSGGGFQLAVMG